MKNIIIFCSLLSLIGCAKAQHNTPANHHLPEAPAVTDSKAEPVDSLAPLSITLNEEGVIYKGNQISFGSTDEMISSVINEKFSSASTTMYGSPVISMPYNQFRVLVLNEGEINAAVEFSALLKNSQDKATIEPYNVTITTGTTLNKLEQLFEEHNITFTVAQNSLTSKSLFPQRSVQFLFSEDGLTILYELLPWPRTGLTY